MRTTAQSIIRLYHGSFTDQRNSLNTSLLHTPEWEVLRQTSDAKFQEALGVLKLNNCTPENAVLAIDGSFSYRVAVYTDKHKSDLDGVLYVKDNIDMPTIDALSQSIDDGLASLGITSNLRVASPLWTPTNPNRKLATAEEIGGMIMPLLCGAYIWGEFNEERTLQFFQNADNERLGFFQEYLEERFWYMIKEGSEKYRKRLFDVRSSGKESL